MVDAQLLALRIAYLVKESGKNRLTISEAKLEILSNREVLPIPYLADLKRHLEELGYFLGTLAKGGFCLLSIESLEGAPSLPTDDRLLAVLNAMPRNKLEEYCITPVVVLSDDHELNEEEKQISLLHGLWEQLVKKASISAVMSYGELAKELSEEAGYKVHHKKVVVLLASIDKLCAEKDLPPLGYLVINGKTELPKALDKVEQAESRFVEEKAKIYAYKWQAIANPFVSEDGDSVDTEAAPALLLEDLSSKESVVDNLNRNELANEALVVETRTTENDNKTGINSEENNAQAKEGVFHKPANKTIEVKHKKKKVFIRLEQLTGTHGNNQER